MCILFPLLQPKAAQNEPVPLTKRAVCDNLSPVARGAALHEFKKAPHVKTGSNTSCYKASLAILYKLYNPIFAVFKGQFLQRAGVTKRLLLKLFILIAIIRLTSALKQTVIARHSFGNDKTMLSFSNLT